MQLRWIGWLLATTVMTGPALSAAADPPAEPSAAPADANAEHTFLVARAEAEKAGTAEEGLAVWTAYLKQFPEGPKVVQAAAEREVWQQRVDAGLVRFGPNWIGREEAQRRNQQVDALLKEAATAPDVNVALKLLNDAAVLHPWRLDVPFTRGELMLKADRLTDAAAAYDAALRIEADQAAAANNLGVLSARQLNWARAIQHLLKAARSNPADPILDNLDLTMWLAKQKGYSATALAAADKQLRQIIDQMHAAGKQKGMTRWGNKWVSQEQYDKSAKEAADIEKQAAATRGKLDKLQSQSDQTDAEIESMRREMRDRFDRWGRGGGRPNDTGNLRQRFDSAYQQREKLREQIRQAQSELDAFKAKYPEPTHANRLVLLDQAAAKAIDEFPLASTKADDGAKDNQGDKGNGGNDNNGDPGSRWPRRPGGGG
ncbi:MAG: hypothetical protein BIFFINMI_00723 [Phycisphaerae bacterium]|nr:hypothetical protein [Phycisphaerae bacterium]